MFVRALIFSQFPSFVTVCTQASTSAVRNLSSLSEQALKIMDKKQTKTKEPARWYHRHMLEKYWEFYAQMFQ